MNPRTNPPIVEGVDKKTTFKTKWSFCVAKIGLPRHFGIETFKVFLLETVFIFGKQFLLRKF